MAKSKRQQRRAYMRGEPSSGLSVTVIGGVFALLIIGVLAGVLIMQFFGAGPGGRTTQAATNAIQQNQAQANATATAVRLESDLVQRVDLGTAKQLYDSKQATLIDARNPGEFQQQHIAGAINIPYYELTQKQSLLPADKAAPIVVYCA